MTTQAVYEMFYVAPALTKTEQMTRKTEKESEMRNWISKVKAEKAK